MKTYLDVVSKNLPVSLGSSLSESLSSLRKNEEEDEREQGQDDETMKSKRGEEVEKVDLLFLVQT